MHNRFHRPNNEDSERVRGRTKTGQSKNARDDKERWSFAEEEYSMVSCSRQLQGYGRKGSRKLLLVPSVSARRQPRQVPDRNDECSSGHSRLGKIILIHGQGLGKISSDSDGSYREGRETLAVEDPSGVMLEDWWFRRRTLRCSIRSLSSRKGRDVPGRNRSISCLGVLDYCLGLFVHEL